MKKIIIPLLFICSMSFGQLFSPHNAESAEDLGPPVAADLGLRVGDRLTVSTGERSETLRISGLVDLGIKDLNRKYERDDLAHGDVMFSATGVTSGALLKGVHRFPGGAITHTLIMRSKTGTVRTIEAHHNFRRKPFVL